MKNYIINFWLEGGPGVCRVITTSPENAVAHLTHLIIEMGEMNDDFKILSVAVECDTPPPVLH